MVLEFDETFKTLIRSQKIIGTSSDVKKGTKWLIRSAFIQVILATMFCLIIYNILHHNLKEKDYSQIIKNGVIALIYVVITFEYGILLYYEKSLSKLISDMKTDFELSKQLSVKEQKIIEKYATQGRYVCMQWLFVAMACPTSFLLKSLFLMTCNYYKNNFRLVNYYELYYPSLIEDNKNNIYVFLFLYIFIAFYGYYAGIVYIAYVPVGPMMMIHASGQLELVQNRIDDLFVETETTIINEKLKGIVKQLQHIYGFVDTIQKVFMVAYELSLKGSTLLLPFVFFEVIQSAKRGEFSMEFFSFILPGILFSSTPCYYSDLLMEKGEAVRMALYSCGWESHNDRRARKILLIMLAYALRPIAIRTVFRTLCLEALTDLFQQSYAIFNLLNATC